MEGQCGGCRSDSDCTSTTETPYCLEGRCQLCEPFNQCDLEFTRYVCGSYANNCDSNFHCGSCGTGGVCVEGGRDCSCPADAFDALAPNDTAEAATLLDEMRDAPDSEGHLDALNIATATDVDWYTFHVVDSGLDGNPDVMLSLAAVAPDLDVSDDSLYDVAMWVDCDRGRGNDSVCRAGVSSTETAHGAGCAARQTSAGESLAVRVTIRCAGTIDESGTVMVRVRKSERHGRCDAYGLQLRVD